MKDEYLEGIMAKVPDETLDREKPAMTPSQSADDLAKRLILPARCPCCDLVCTDPVQREAADTIERPQRDLRECVELLREMEPHVDSLICYGSTCLEYKPNDFVRRYHALLARLKETL